MARRKPRMDHFVIEALRGDLPVNPTESNRKALEAAVVLRRGRLDNQARERGLRLLATWPNRTGA